MINIAIGVAIMSNKGKKKLTKTTIVIVMAKYIDPSDV
ncbi:hypothetical protein ACIN5162_0753 [Acinetobacter baumannii OIFC0162]|nr:hypothetical protein A1S_3547 [Acinetobacter baumannii ATCC 17978]EKA66152.1 hypothetical protein ACINIS116_1628 [Acinetobacter baumannii IS-116]EKK04775.1 hypothetical protein ACIN5162_0753 [Acinetobacter baumannii OIFC0162]EKL54060.1 hypothetical protein ACINNAV13_0269 [Acinetobacter baumannii Naval-13]EKP32619.1 hypothetical protein ACIN5065_3623 [Acinetobacter baumannii OIFC065]ETR89535.1 hypothetical protein M214_0752 [Acinetobacter baumannii CI86]ETR91584.1 hypothetical protein M212_